MSGKDSPNEGEQASNVITKAAVRVIEEVIASIDDYPDFDGDSELTGLKKLLNSELHTAFAGRGDCDLNLLRKEAWEIYNRTVESWLDNCPLENKESFVELLRKTSQTRQIGTAVYYKKRKNYRRKTSITAAENKKRFSQYSKKEVVSTAVYPWKYNMKGKEFDCKMDMTSKETRNFLALNYFDEIYTKFEEGFLSKLGLNDSLQSNFKDIVFEEVIKWAFLQDPKALSHSIAWALVRYYDEDAELAEKIHLLQQIYAEDTGQKLNNTFYSINTFCIPELVEEILKSIED
jgi:hypothetical protein